MIVAEAYTKNGQPNRLRNIRSEATLPDGCVELVAMPSDFGPWVYDAATKTAIPAPLDEGEKLDRISLPPRVIAALVVGALPAVDTTASEKAWARSVLLDALGRARQARQ